MSFAAQLRSAATQSEKILAQLAGMAPAATGNFTYNGATYFGVFGSPAPDELMNPGGGFRKRTELPLSATRTQFTAAPRSQTELIRTDVTPPRVYRISAVDTHDPLHYILTLVKVGE